MEMQMIVKKYYEQLYANKLDSLGKMDKFLDTCNLSKVNQKEVENINKLITTNKIEAVNKKLPANKSPEPDGFPGESNSSQIQRTSILLKLLQKI